MKFSELITKPVISLYDSTVEGVIITARFSKNIKKIQSFIVESNNDYDAIDEYELESKDIYKVGQDAIMIKNNYKLNFNTSADKMDSPINYTIYTTSGNRLGKVQDLELDKNFYITKYICENTEIEASKVANIKNGVILVNTDDCNIKTSKFKPKTQNIQLQNTSQDQIAIIMPIKEDIIEEVKEEYAEQQPEQYIVEQEQNVINGTIPRLVSQDYTLVGKTITQNIITANGEVIARRGNVITPSTINLASMHQKLRELTFYAK